MTLPSVPNGSISTRIPFENLNNTRDLGGMPAADGRRIKPGKLIRSGHLFRASEADCRRLTELVGCVVDFRTTRERTERPDPDLREVENIHLPILGKPAAGITREVEEDAGIDRLFGDAPASRDHMCRMYANFPVSQVALAGYRRFVELLARERAGAVLWHCTAGKDRAGFGAVIVQEILGVPRGLIGRDYLFTNECLAGEVSHLEEMLLSRTPDGAEARKGAKASFSYLFGAKQEYLDAAYLAVGENYGTFPRFLEAALGVTPDVRDRLRDMYLE